MTPRPGQRPPATEHGRPARTPPPTTAAPADPPPPAARARRRRSMAAGLVVFPVLVVLSLLPGDPIAFGIGDALEGLAALLGWREPLEGSSQIILELRLRKALTAAGVGAALAYSGALLQGVFRNGLASPSILGITAGASLGATLAILIVGGYGGAANWLELAAERSPLLVTAGGFAGAAGVALLVTVIAGGAGRVSIPTLLLVGIAINACLNGVITALTAWLVEHDWQISQAVFHWSFGSLNDKAWSQVALVWTAVLVASAVYPLVARELDLFAGGEEDAESLGVRTRRVRLLALGAASLSAAAARSSSAGVNRATMRCPLRMMTSSPPSTLRSQCAS